MKKTDIVLISLTTLALGTAHTHAQEVQPQVAEESIVNVDTEGEISVGIEKILSKVMHSAENDEEVIINDGNTIIKVSSSTSTTTSTKAGKVPEEVRQLFKILREDGALNLRKLKLGDKPVVVELTDVNGIVDGSITVDGKQIKLNDGNPDELADLLMTSLKKAGMSDKEILELVKMLTGQPSAEEDIEETESVSAPSAEVQDTPEK